MSDASVGEVIFKPITQRKADLTNGVVVGAKSGSWEPRSAKPRATGLLVLSPKMREAAETALAQRRETTQCLASRDRRMSNCHHKR